MPDKVSKKGFGRTSLGQLAGSGEKRDIDRKIWEKSYCATKGLWSGVPKYLASGKTKRSRSNDTNFKGKGLRGS